MNRTPTTSETNSAKSPPQAVFNYAEAAKRSSQIQDQQQSPRTQSPSSTSGNNNDSNKKGNNNTNGAVNGSATTQSAVNTQPQQASFASTVASATNSSSNKSASPAAKNARNASVQLPRAPPTDAAPIQFGSINQGTDSPAQSSSNKNGDVAPVLKSSEVTFGSLPATDASSTHVWQGQSHIRIQGGTQQQQQQQKLKQKHTLSLSPKIPRTMSAPPNLPYNADKNNSKLFTQPFAPQGTQPQSHNHQQQRRDSAQSNHSEQGSPHYNNNSTSHNNNTSNNNNNNNNNTSRHYRHYNQNKHQGMPHSPNMQNSQPYVPHHQKKPISPHMQSAPSPNVAGQNMPMPPNWGSPSPVHRQHQPPYYVPPNFEGQQHHYYQPYNMGGYVGQGGNNAPPAPGASQPYVPPQRNNKAIRIINPETMTEVKAEAVASSSSSTANSSTKESTSTKPSSEDHQQRTTPTIKKEELKSSTSSTPSSAPGTAAPSSSSTSTSNTANSPSSKAIPIVDPAIKDREAREKREREEAAQKAKEEEERKAKEEAERKEREEKERLEAEQKAKEEAERKAKEEAERKAKEEADRKAKEEADRIEAEKKAKEEAERKAKEEQEKKEAEEKKAKEEAERKAKEEQEKKEAEEKKAKEEAEQEAKKKEAASATPQPARLDMEAVSKSSPAVANSLTATPTAVTPASAKPTPSKTTRTIEDPSTIQYPATVKAPFGSKDPNGKITYEPNFLLQFAPLCLESSEDLSQFQNIAEEQQQNDRPRSMSRRQTSERGRGGPRTPTMDMGMFRHGSRDGRMEMGKFAGGRPLSHRAGSGSHALPPAGTPGSPGGMQREGSHGGRTRSGRGGKGRHGKGGDNQEKQERQQQGAPTIPPEQVKPLEQSQNRWVPLALRKQREAEKAAESDLLSDEVIIRKVKSLLNKLTLEKFDSISGQIWDYAKQSEKEEDGRALKVVIQLTFDKACDEPAFATMWAQLCRKMYDSITDDIKDVNVKDKEGNTVSGVNLLRKYLLNRCQHDFERGWKMQIPEVDQNNPDMMSDEYYAAVKAKRQGLGLVVFIGELFKRQMLTDRIMLQCLTRLCDNPKEVGDEETETMVKLITTIGKPLDISNRKNKEWLDVYFERMKEMMESPNLSSRIKFMILDLFDLRKNKWVSRRSNQVAPTTIAQVHEQAQKAKIEEKEAMKRTTSSRGSLPHPMSRAGSHRGAGSRDLQREGSTGSNAASTTVDGWSTVGSGSPGGSSKGTRANELANFGKTDRSKARSSVLGPGNSPFASLHRASKSGGDQKSSPSESRSSSANMFSALGGEGGDDGHNESHQEENKSEDKQESQQEDSSEATSTTTTTTTTTTTSSSTPVATDSNSNTPQED